MERELRNQHELVSSDDVEAIEPTVAPLVQRKSNQSVSQEASRARSERLSGGNALPDDLQSSMGQAFGTDFSGVRVHENASQATALQAKAYTQGNDIAFAPGQYNPASQAGRDLIGHELTHVVQQSAGVATATAQGKDSAVINSDPALEREADVLGAAAARGQQVQVSGATGGVQLKAESAVIQRDGETGTLDLDGKAIVDTSNPGVKGKFKRNAQVQVGDAARDVASGTPCIIFDNGGDNVTVEIFRYEGEDEDKTMVTEYTGTTARRNVKTSRSHKRKTGHLFARDPSTADINQGAIGDCYLMAAMLSLVNEDPGFVKGMMKDEGDGSVVVRLYECTNGDDGFASTAKYIRLEKSVLHTSWASAEHNKGGLWATILEKAFAAFGRSASRETAHQNTSKSYEAIGHGGHGNYAYEILTGRSATSELMSTSDTRAQADPMAPNNIINPKPFFEGLGIDMDDGELAEWKDFALDHALDFTALGADGATVRIEGVEAILAEMPNAVLRNKLLGYMRRRYPGRRGTARYSDNQIVYYNKIRDRLAAHQFVSVGSNKFEGGGGHSGNEGSKQGLVGPHAYACIDVKTDDQGQKWIKMRNPWGNTGRGYKDDGSAKKIKAGEFWLELADLTDDFKNLYYT